MKADMDKRPEKMTEQDTLLELQMEVKDKAKVYDILMIAFFILIVYIFAILIFVLPDKEFSEQENRMLAKRPVFSTKSQSFVERLIDGTFTSEISSYYSDQFPARDIFTGIKGVTEILMLKRENNGIILGKNGYIVKREDYPDYNNISSNLKYINDFAKNLEGSDTELYFALAGRPLDFLSKYLPMDYPKNTSEELWNYLIGELGGNISFTFINLLETLKEAAEVSNEQLYYKADHHWTSLGAYYAYAEIMSNFFKTPRDLNVFLIETAASNFYGTSWSSAGMKWIKPDTIEYFRYEGDDTEYMTLIDDDGSSYMGFYNRSYLEKKDKYGSFIGGSKSANNARVDVIKISEENREKLLIIKDSFAHSIVPFLSYHYDLVIIDLRYYYDSVTSLIEKEGIGKVLILNYAGSLSESVIYNRLY